MPELSVFFKQTADYLCKKYKVSPSTFKKSYDAEVKQVPPYPPNFHEWLN